MVTERKTDDGETEVNQFVDVLLLLTLILTDVITLRCHKLLYKDVKQWISMLYGYSLLNKDTTLAPSSSKVSRDLEYIES